MICISRIYGIHLSMIPGITVAVRYAKYRESACMVRAKCSKSEN